MCNCGQRVGTAWAVRLGSGVGRRRPIDVADALLDERLQADRVFQA